MRGRRFPRLEEEFNVGDRVVVHKGGEEVYVGEIERTMIGWQGNRYLEILLEDEAEPSWFPARDVVRIGTNTWAFRLDANESDDAPDLAITIAVGGSIAPGSYNLGCVIEALTFKGGR